MNKSILVIDTPRNCNECQYCEYIQSDEYMWCHLKFRIVENDMKKPSWCPLKPIPQEKEDLYFPCNEYEKAFNEGFNRCIDEILGEQE